MKKILLFLCMLFLVFAFSIGTAKATIMEDWEGNDWLYGNEDPLRFDWDFLSVLPLVNTRAPPCVVLFVSLYKVAYTN